MCESGKRLSHTAAGHIAEGRDGKVSVHILDDGAYKAILVEDSKLIHGNFPVIGSTSPIGGDIAQGQPDEPGDGIVAGKVAAGFDDFAQSGIDVLVV